MAKVVGDWTAGMEGWQASDPWEQCWKDHLYQVVETNSNLPTWGSCGKITLQPVPEVAGATGSYLYLKDCGEFDTEKYQYDLNYMNYVFGLPLGVTGKAANNFIDDILLNVVGVAPQKGGANSLSATGNTNGLHVYNDYDWALVSKEITASDGNMLKFGWSFQGGDAKHGDDAAFWILKDVATGEIVASDLLAQGPDAVNGTAEVLLPSAGGCGTYILTIGQMNVGTYNGDQHKGNPHMLIGSVVQEQNDNVVGPVFSPNLQPLPLTEVIGDWDNGLSGWMVSDPWEQCWQDYLYQYVNTNVNLQGWGACGKITLPPVPHVDGATGKYLYLKDCGEFDTEKYDYDLNYLNYAFGLPTGVKGKDANNFIDDILLNVVGVSPQKGGTNCLSATGNANGLHVYNDYDWNLVSKEIEAPLGGTVKFGWSFLSGDAKHGDDAAFWVLKDAVTGEIIAGDLLAQGGSASGIAEVSLPDYLTGSGTYILTIGQMNVGTYNCDQIKGNPHMLIGDVVLERDPVEIASMSLSLDFDGGIDFGAVADMVPEIANPGLDLSNIDVVGIDQEMAYG